MLNELSEFLRYSLVNKAEMVTLKDELEAVLNYLDIEQIRFEDKLKVNFDISPETEQFSLPNFLLHTLVENAVKYGMKTSKLPVEIEIKAQAVNDSLRLEISNTGNWIEASPNGLRRNGSSTQIGLENVRRRLEQAFPARHKFETSSQNGRVCVRLEISQN